MLCLTVLEKVHFFKNSIKIFNFLINSSGKAKPSMASRVIIILEWSAWWCQSESMERCLMILAMHCFKCLPVFQRSKSLEVQLAQPWWKKRAMQRREVGWGAIPPQGHGWPPTLPLSVDPLQQSSMALRWRRPLLTSQLELVGWGWGLTGWQLSLPGPALWQLRAVPLRQLLLQPSQLGRWPGLSWDPESPVRLG